MSRSSTDPVSAADRTDAISASGPFNELVRRRSRLISVLLTASSVWFLLFIIGCSYWHDFMALPLVEGLSVAYAWGLSQFVVVWVVTGIYLRSSSQTFVPLQEEALAAGGGLGAGEARA